MTNEKSYKPSKCSFAKDGTWRPCGLMRALADDKKPGLREAFLFDFGGNSVTTIPVLHSGEHRKNGVVLNYCPICGVSLKRLYHKRKAKP